MQDCRFLAHSTPMAQGSLGLQLKFESSVAQGGRAAGLLHELIKQEIAETERRSNGKQMMMETQGPRGSVGIILG